MSYDHEAHWDALWTWADTQAVVDAKIKAQASDEAQIKRDLLIDSWLRRNPDAGCSRKVAGVLADLEARFAAKCTELVP